MYEREFIIMPESSGWRKVMARSAEGAYHSESCWYTNKRMAVWDTATGEITVFNSRHDSAGNLIEVWKENNHGI